MLLEIKLRVLTNANLVKFKEFFDVTKYLTYH